MSAKIDGDEPRRNLFPPGKLLNLRDAAAYLGVSRRWLESNPDIPRVNLALPGRIRAMRRFRVADLDAYATARRVPPDSGR